MRTARQGFVWLLLAAASLPAAAQVPLGSGFLYQGQLVDGTDPANGDYDFVFDLYDDPAAGNLVGTATHLGVAVGGGVFAVELDFGAAAFDGEARWLEIRVASAGAGSFTTLAPRQPIAATPYALWSLGADTLDGLDAADFLAASGGEVGGDLVVSGQLGVGEPTPSSALEVAGAIEAQALLDNAGGGFFAPCAAGSAIRVIAADGAVTCEPVGGGGDNLGDHAATQNIRLLGNLLSGDGDAEGVFVASDGKVGIGTFVPAEALHVGGNQRFEPAARIFFGSASTYLSESNGNLTLFAHLTSGSDIELSAEDNVEIESDDDIFLLPNDDLRIEPGGQVAIGNVNNPTRILTIEQGLGRAIADGWDSYSSIRWKEDVRTLDGALDKILGLRGVSFTWRGSGERSLGLIAEEVEAILPEVVAYGAEGEGAIGIDYLRLVPLLVEALEEQYRELQELRAIVCGETGRC